MAILYPTLETIRQLKVTPTDGEIHLLRFIQDKLDDSYELFFQPFLNGDRPDIVLVRRGYGVLIIEVKDWNLDAYGIDVHGKWYLQNHRGFVLSPFEQVKHYKENMYNWHIEGLLEKNILNQHYFGLIQCGVYFHKEAASD